LVCFDRFSLTQDLIYHVNWWFASIWFPLTRSRTSKTVLLVVYSPVLLVVYRSYSIQFPAHVQWLLLAAMQRSATKMAVIQLGMGVAGFNQIPSLPNIESKLPFETIQNQKYDKYNKSSEIEQCLSKCNAEF
jgi:hypothetical protein